MYLSRIHVFSALIWVVSEIYKKALKVQILKEVAPKFPVIEI